jgi:hypothetical protein
MKKLVIITVLVVGLIGGLVGGTVFAATRPPAGPVAGPVLMDGGSGNFTAYYNEELEPSFVSPQYKQMRHISVTLWAKDMTEYDGVYVRAWIDSRGIPSGVVVLKFTSSDIHARTIEFDATQWEIVGDDYEGTFPFPVYFNYTTTYPNSQNTQ